MDLVLFELLLSSPTMVAKFSPEAEAAVDKLEALGEDVTDVGQVEEHEGNAKDGVQNGHQLAPVGLWCDVAITWKDEKNDKYYPSRSVI
ncbi:hypothetical protein AVEN_102739-1 [Araneus ventricosus]|uniref:Uncharacterized protein n=2 Tax=Araneus ventricosus TaxID=182803 RepID=A0A4Y2W548_ARAVE|nr:hypothetical protein AVEN_102739-1 [Araneus ventricosus]